MISNKIISYEDSVKIKNYIDSTKLRNEYAPSYWKDRDLLDKLDCY